MTQSGTQIALPVARNDEDTLEERLTENAYNTILPGRYLKKDEDGNVTEDPEELFHRVAKNIAVAELVHLDKPIHIHPEHIKPDHPRRDELVNEVFGDDTDAPELLTEANAKYVAHDAIKPDLSGQATQRLEHITDQFRTAMEHLKFIPNTPTLANAGDELQQLSACFVMSPDDDLTHIHETATRAAKTFQSGGGCGYAFSQLRPYGDTVGSTGGIASGPITFMETYDQMCETIAQGGARRGAQMGVLRCDHPDIIHFIHAKNKDTSLAHVLRLNDPKDYRTNSFGDALEEARELIDENGKVPPHLRNACEGFLSNFNISVAVSDEFMAALEQGEDYTLINPRTGEPHIATAETKEMYGWFGMAEFVEVGEPLELPAAEIWQRIVEGAWENGEPGVIYIDRVNADHSFDTALKPDHEMQATNPCAEQPLEEFEACNLGHINLSTVVAEDRTIWPEFDGDMDAFLEQAIDWEELDARIALGTQFLDNVVTMSDFPVPEIEDTVSGMRKIGLGVMGLAQMFIQIGVRYGSEEGNEVTRQLMTHINHESKRVSRNLGVRRGVFDEWSDSKYASPTSYPDWFEDHVGEPADMWDAGYPLRNHNTTTIAPTGTTSMVADTSGGCEPIHNVAYYKNVSNDLQGDEMLVEFDSLFLRTLQANDIDVAAAKAEAQELMENNLFEGPHSLSMVPDAIADLFVTTDQLSGKEHAAVLCAAQAGVDSSISKTCNFPHDATVAEMDEVYRYIYENGGKSVTVYRDGSRTKQVIQTRADNQEVGESGDNTGIEEMVEEEFGVDYETLQALAEAAQEGEARPVADGGENSGDVCECGSSLVYQEGCVTCSNPDCTFSKCEV